MTTTTDRLRQVPLFQGLKDSDLEKVLEAGKEVRHDAGKTILEADESGVGFHLIREGQAEVLVGGAVVRTVGPGSYFGEMSVIDGGPRSATVRAMTDLVTFSLPAWTFQELIDKHPSMAKALLVELCSRIRKIDAGVTH
jgi:cAMP-binding proteins - catabolite gene activator and regulatory subunit of cAMP-dependent protein kinases